MGAGKCHFSIFVKSKVEIGFKSYSHEHGQFQQLKYEPCIGLLGWGFLTYNNPKSHP